jgi:hypothetical protein
MPGLSFFATNYSGEATLFLALTIFIIHVRIGPQRLIFHWSCAALVMIGSAFYWLGSQKPMIFVDVVFLTLAYGVCVFTIFSELMMVGLAKTLTAWRGEIWIKEIDYIYLSLAAIGVLVTINHFPAVQDKIDMPDTYGLLVLATALVIRALKVRAEINGWNKNVATG